MNTLTTGTKDVLTDIVHECLLRIAPHDRQDGYLVMPFRSKTVILPTREELRGALVFTLIGRGGDKTLLRLQRPLELPALDGTGPGIRLGCEIVVQREQLQTLRFIEFAPAAV